MNTKSLGVDASQVEPSNCSRRGFDVNVFKSALVFEWLRWTLEPFDELGKTEAFNDIKLIWVPAATERGITEDAEAPDMDSSVDCGTVTPKSDFEITCDDRRKFE